MCNEAILSSASSSSPVIMRKAASGTNGSAAEFKITSRSSIASCTVSSSREERSIDMALYIDSAFLNDIMNVTQTVPLAGATTNPSIMLAARGRGQDLDSPGGLDALLRRLGGHSFIQAWDRGGESVDAH